jgi:hypothetical protein
VGYYGYFWGYYPKAGVAHLVYLFILTVQALRSIYLLYLYGWVKKVAGTIRTQSQFVFFAFLIYFFAAVDFLVNYGVEFYPTGFVFILIAFNITAYAIVKHKLMDIEVVIRKGLIYSVVIAIFTGLYLSAVYLATRMFENVLGIGSIGIGAGLVFLFALLFQPLKDKVNQVIDRVFFKSEYEYRVALKEISRNISEAKDLGELNGLVSGKIKDVFRVKHARIWRVE